jgi:hypothetical protein
MDVKTKGQSMLKSLEEAIAKSCFCKLREFCPDKSDCECYKNSNIYKEFMTAQKN